MSLRLLHPWILLTLLLVPALIYLFSQTRHRSTRFSLASAMRVFAISLLIFAAAEPEYGGRAEGASVVFLVDRSASVSGDQEQAEQRLIRAIESMKPADRAAMIVFGGDSAIEEAPSSGFEHDGFDSVIDESATDIESALLSAISLLGNESRTATRRIYLLTDGVQTKGGARNAAAVASRLEIPIDVSPLDSRDEGPDEAIIDVAIPNEIESLAPFEFTVFVTTNRSSPHVAELFVTKDGEFIGADRIELLPGTNRATYTAVADSNGIDRYEFYLQSEGDATPENNSYHRIVRVTGAPVVLYVSKPAEPSRAFLEALHTQGIETRSTDSANLPADVGALLGFEAIIFDDVPAFDLSFARMEAIERYVRDFGGGFLMLGGESSYGLGGYLNTPVERLLPVDMDVTSSLDIPSLALVMIVDKSGSMGDTIAGGETKLDLVKEAVIASVEILNPYYTVGLLAFDADIAWTIEPVQAGNRNQIITDLAGLASGGGTKLYPAMAAGFAGLRETPAAVKHMLILSDGLTDDGDFDSLVAEIREAGITVSTIAVGSDSDRELMEMIADAGGGRSYFTDDIERVPRIFASESMIVSRGLIVEERFVPVPEDPTDVTRGIDLTTMPPLDGFVLAYTKSTATQALTTFNRNPLLAHWQYGLGRSAAFTSDLKGRWGRSWLDWTAYPTFVAQLVRWIERSTPPTDLEVELQTEAGRATVTVDAIDANGDFLNTLDLEAVLLVPDGTTETRDFRQTAPGRYELEFDVRETGDYVVSVYDPDTPAAPIYRSISVPYPVEFLAAGRNPELLASITTATGGRLSPAADEVFLVDQEARTYRPLWPWLIGAALLLFVAEIAVRQIGSRVSEPETGETKEARVRSGTRKSRYDQVIERIERSTRVEAEKRRELSYWFGKQERH